VLISHLKCRPRYHDGGSTCCFVPAEPLAGGLTARTCLKKHGLLAVLYSVKRLISLIGAKRIKDNLPVVDSVEWERSQRSPLPHYTTLYYTILHYYTNSLSLVAVESSNLPHLVAVPGVDATNRSSPPSGPLQNRWACAGRSPDPPCRLVTCSRIFLTVYLLLLCMSCLRSA
jgi:hypothetical protein